ncbi:MAG: ABC transporter ATP-binding protein, partial [Colwellia sp.]|nr:ABC transporter ATP-binding protein [Colwellia sp.]
MWLIAVGSARQFKNWQPDKPMLKIKNLSVSLAGNDLLRDVSLEVGAGEMLCILGESGAGKSTLLKAVMGLLPCRYDHFDYAPANCATSQKVPGLSGSRWVMQDPLAALNPKRGLGQSICESLYRHKLSASDQRQAALDALEMVELPNQFYDRRPGEVSLGQAQRACLARALVAEPEMILFDEPLSALDALVQKKIALRMDHLRDQKAMTYIVVTHDLGFAATYADHILLLRNGKTEA